MKRKQLIGMIIFVLSAIGFVTFAFLSQHEPSAILSLGAMIVTFPIAFASTRK